MEGAACDMEAGGQSVRYIFSVSVSRTRRTEIFNLTSAHKTSDTFGRNLSEHNLFLDNEALPVTA